VYAEPRWSKRPLLHPHQLLMPQGKPSLDLRCAQRPLALPGPTACTILQQVVLELVRNDVSYVYKAAFVLLLQLAGSKGALLYQRAEYLPISASPNCQSTDRIQRPACALLCTATATSLQEQTDDSMCIFSRFHIASTALTIPHRSGAKFKDKKFYPTSTRLCKGAAGSDFTP
jgi:hypothetical protein